MSSYQLKEIRSYNSELEAQYFRDGVAEHGYFVELLNQSVNSSVYPISNNRAFEIRMVVKNDDFDEIQKILTELEESIKRENFYFGDATLDDIKFDQAVNTGNVPSTKATKIGLTIIVSVLVILFILLIIKLILSN